MLLEGGIYAQRLFRGVKPRGLREMSDVEEQQLDNVVEDVNIVWEKGECP